MGGNCRSGPATIATIPDLVCQLLPVKFTISLSRKGVVLYLPALEGAPESLLCILLQCKVALAATPIAVSSLGRGVRWSLSTPARKVALAAAPGAGAPQTPGGHDYIVGL